MLNFIRKFTNKLYDCNVMVIISVLKKDGQTPVTKPCICRLIALSSADCRIATVSDKLDSFEITRCLDQDEYVLKLQIIDKDQKNVEFLGKLNWLNKAFERVADPFLMKINFLDRVKLNDMAFIRF